MERASLRTRLARRAGAIWGFDLRRAVGAEPGRKALIIGVLACVVSGAWITENAFDAATPALLDTIAGKLDPSFGALDAHGLRTFAYATFGAMVLLAVVVEVHAFWVYFHTPGKRAELVAVYWANSLARITNLLGIVALGALAAAAAALMGSDAAEGGDALLQRIADGPGQSIAKLLPTIASTVGIAAFGVFVLFAGLTNYAFHRLNHVSRLLWLTCHRPHHVPSVLHPGAFAPPSILAIITDRLPNGILIGVAFKLFPIDVSTAVAFWYYALYNTTDLLSHNTALYEASYRNRLLRGMSLLFGTGVYHYTHHSSRPGDEQVNLGVFNPFMIWDRIFGTYRAPTKEPPPVGLTKSPEVRLSPWLIAFSGYQQIAFELRANKSWRTRFWILFGSVRFKPPVSRDFLIVGYPEASKEPPEERSDIHRPVDASAAE